MNNLVEFLTARLDEDERIARETNSQPRRRYEWEVREISPRRSPSVCSLGEVYRVVDDVPDEVAKHIARHDPARVLAEVKAKRDLLRLSDGRSEWNQPASIVGYNAAYRDVLILLALPYADHPDYPPEWKP